MNLADVFYYVECPKCGAGVHQMCRKPILERGVVAGYKEKLARCPERANEVCRILEDYAKNKEAL